MTNTLLSAIRELFEDSPYLCHEGGAQCPFCYGYERHDGDCKWARVEKLLADEPVSFVNSRGKFTVRVENGTTFISMLSHADYVLGSWTRLEGQFLSIEPIGIPESLKVEAERGADEPELERKLATSLLRRKHMQALLVQVVGLAEEYGAPAWREDWLGQLKLHEQLIAADETTTGRSVTGMYCDHGIPISIECTECTAENRSDQQG